MSTFRIPSIPPTTNKTIRFPNDVIDAVEQAIRGRDCTFSAFVIAAVRAALETVAESPNNRTRCEYLPGRFLSTVCRILSYLIHVIRFAPSLTWLGKPLEQPGVCDSIQD